MSTYENARQRLGVGSVVGDTFNIFFSRFGLMFALALVPALISQLLSFGILLLVGGTAGTNPTAAGAVFGILSYIAALFTYSLSISLIVLAAFDAKLNRPGRIGVYIRWALLNLFTVVVLSFVVSLLLLVPIVVLFALVFAISPGGGALAAIVSILTIAWVLYVSAAFAALVPAIVIEGVGFRGLRRSLTLTSGYRWSIVGVVLVLFIAIMLMGMLIGLIGTAGSINLGVWVNSIIQLAVGAISGGLFAVGLALVYARLREIKEGLNVDSLADIFA